MSTILIALVSLAIGFGLGWIRGEFVGRKAGYRAGSR